MKRGWPLLLLLGSCSGQPAIAPHGIVSNNPCIDSVLAEIAAPGQIAAVSIYSHDPNSGSAPLGWAMAYPAVGTSAEEIIAARPALLLTGNLASNGTNAALAKAGVKMLAFGVPATLEEDAAQIRQIANAIGREEAGEALVVRIASAIGSTRQTSPQSAIIWQTGGFVAGKGTLQDELLARAGFANASVTYGLNQWDILPLETLIRNPPSIIFMPRSAKGDDARALAMREDVLRHLRGKTRIVDFPDRLLFCGGPTIIKAMELMRAAHKPLTFNPKWERLKQTTFNIHQPAHPEEGLSLSKTRLEGSLTWISFETPFRQAQWLLRMSGSYI
jgi:iron complex transport system substrate-binding protein